MYRALENASLADPPPRASRVPYIDDHIFRLESERGGRPPLRRESSVAGYAQNGRYQHDRDTPTLRNNKQTQVTVPLDFVGLVTGYLAARQPRVCPASCDLEQSRFRSSHHLLASNAACSRRPVRSTTHHGEIGRASC